MELSLQDLANKKSEELFAAFNSSASGITEEEARRRIVQAGVNEFVTRRTVRPLYLLLSKFKNPVLLMLIIASVISLFLGSVIDASIILFMVLLSAVIDFINTYRSEKTVEELRESVRVTALTMRGGKAEELPVERLVPGDIVILAAGDLVPADAILLQGRDVFVNESILTGESVPAEKNPDVAAERTVYMGTSVVSGEAQAIVVYTGRRTKIGSIAEKLQTTEPPTEFERNLKDFSVFVFRISLFLVLAILLFHFAFMQRDLFEVFLFAVAIAVGIAPELLPMIVTANLAKGALRMSRGGVIVKKLPAIHNFGSIDVLCTDKTGTLTEDKISLIKYVNGTGKDDPRVFFWGYVSSAYHSGVRGVLDAAIRDHKKVSMSEWKKLDEIPFDYERKRDSVVVGGTHGGATMVTKGAPEEIMRVCTTYGEENETLSKTLRATIEKEYNALSRDGFRVLAVAVRKVPKRAAYAKSDEVRMSFLGFLAFMDPPKNKVGETLMQMTAHGIAIKVITGDNYLVTKKIASEIGLAIEGVITGEEMEHMHPHEFQKRVETTTVFSRVNPEQKETIIKTLRTNGHVVAYLGDGVNDLLSLRAADVSISVNNAVDIAKQTADIILLKKGLGEIVEGVIEGRKTFANIFKYLMMALSSNFGNMFSIPIASVFLPFLPMTASQILFNNLIYDSSQFAIPFDRVDDDFLMRPKKFNIRFLRRFMMIFGPLSSFFDLTTFFMLRYVFGLAGGAFQTGWFLESIATQTLVVNLIRSRLPFSRSKPSKFLFLSSLGVTLLAWVVPLTFLSGIFGFSRLAPHVLFTIIAIVVIYLFAVELVKHFFYKYWGSMIEK